MACRVGMTTNTEDRKNDHDNDYKNLRDWEILASGLSRTDAEQRESDEATARGCDAHGGGCPFRRDGLPGNHGLRSPLQAGSGAIAEHAWVAAGRHAGRRTESRRPLGVPEPNGNRAVKK